MLERRRQAPPVRRSSGPGFAVPPGWRDVRLVSHCERIETAAGNVFAAGTDETSTVWPVVSPIVADLLFKATTLTLASEVLRLADRHEVRVEEVASHVVTHLPTLLSLGLVDVVEVDD